MCTKKYQDIYNMELNGNAFIPCDNKKHAHSIVATASSLKKVGKLFVCRFVKIDEVEGVRIWRLK